VSQPVDLDEVLSKPLPEIADNGFSHTVMLRVMERRARRMQLIGALAAGALVVFCLAMPFTAVGQAVNIWALDLVAKVSAPLEVVAAALVCSGLIVQLFSDWIGSQASSRRSSSS